jgi:hypothetical protein
LTRSSAKFKERTWVSFQGFFLTSTLSPQPERWRVSAAATSFSCFGYYATGFWDQMTPEEACFTWKIDFFMRLTLPQESTMTMTTVL